MGEFTVEMYWKHAPNTCRNFMELIRRGYYNNTKFHRYVSLLFYYEFYFLFIHVCISIFYVFQSH